MLSFAPSARVFIALDPVDMRGSFDRLAGDVRRLGADPLDGGLYLFVNRRRTLLRALWFDRTGWALFAKRLERGTFELPVPRDGARRVALDPSELAMILEGIDLSARRRLRYRREPSSRESASEDPIRKRIDNGERP
jgi:transposase